MSLSCAACSRLHSLMHSRTSSCSFCVNWSQFSSCWDVCLTFSASSLASINSVSSLAMWASRRFASSSILVILLIIRWNSDTVSSTMASVSSLSLELLTLSLFFSPFFLSFLFLRVRHNSRKQRSKQNGWRNHPFPNKKSNGVLILRTSLETCVQLNYRAHFNYSVSTFQMCIKGALSCYLATL